MIDTIVLHIHNISKYPAIYGQFYKPDQKSVTTAFVDEHTGEIMENIKIPALVYHDTNRFLPVIHRSSTFIASSHYTLSYLLKNDTLMFNFSIPKYLYGNNLIQFFNRWDATTGGTWHKFQNFLAAFFQKQFIQIPDYLDVEIVQIDLCYNQFFNTKDDALTYLEEQKKLLTKYMKGKQGAYVYSTSLMYKTQRYSQKIYHKGTEFKKHDLPEIMKLGNPNGYDLDYLQETADKILRYEVSLRKGQLNYFVNQYYLQSQTKAEIHKYRTHPVAKIYMQMAQYGGKKFTEKFINTSKGFYLKSLYDYSLDLHHHKNNYNLTFDRQLFEICFDFLHSFILKYRIITMVSPERILETIEKFNRKVDVFNKIAPPSAKLRQKTATPLMLYTLLGRYEALPVVDKLLPKTTRWRIKKDLKEVGIEPGNSNILVPTPRTDYLDYLIYFGALHPDF